MTNPIGTFDAFFARDEARTIDLRRDEWLAIKSELTQLRGNLSLAEEGLANAMQEIERLKETLNCPTLTAEAPVAQFKAVLDQAEKNEPVNVQDLINALWWRVRNQKREIARLHEKRRATEHEWYCVCGFPLPSKDAVCEACGTAEWEMTA